VRDAADVAARERGKRLECNRYFTTAERFIVVLSAFCGSYFGKGADSRILIAYDSDGSVLGEMWWITIPGTAELHPYMRFQDAV
jgi:hypothetical protein